MRVAGRYICLDSVSRAFVCDRVVSRSSCYAVGSPDHNATYPGWMGAQVAACVIGMAHIPNTGDTSILEIFSTSDYLDTDN